MTSRGHTLVLGDGAVSASAELDHAWPGWSDGIDRVVAADGGARHAGALGRELDLWVGDGDSIDADQLLALERAGVPIRRSPTDKDETDAELAILAALDADPVRITFLGGLGGARLDHALANVWLLDHPALVGRDVRLLDARCRIRLARVGTLSLEGAIGDLVSLLPFGGDAVGITTVGLRYPLRDEPLRSGPSRGLSNVRTSRDASVDVRAGRILVVETPATLPR